MRIDVITIFPELVALLDVALVGRARQSGLLEVAAHDLRDFAHDRHRTVDDTPYGGGAGMVMRAEPWGEALDAVLGVDDPLVVFLTPAGHRFDQATARAFAAERHLVFCCGRYEGIDQRVAEDTALRARVLEVSLGDFVLNGGEVAALAMIEATARLIPGVLGNPESLIEESHENRLLEAPAYTKPAEWRGLTVPSVLRSGDHGAVASWRREQSLERTRRIRPDLLSPPPG